MTLLQPPVRAKAGGQGVFGTPAALPHLAGVENGDPAHEDHRAGHGGDPQQPRVPAQPGEVQGHLLAKIAPGRSAEVWLVASGRDGIAGGYWKILFYPKGMLGPGGAVLSREYGGFEPAQLEGPQVCSTPMGIAAAAAEPPHTDCMGTE